MDLACLCNTTGTDEKVVSCMPIVRVNGTGISKDGRRKQKGIKRTAKFRCCMASILHQLSLFKFYFRKQKTEKSTGTGIKIKL